MIRSDMQLALSLFPMTDPGQFPISFTYDGRLIRGIPASFSTERTTRLIDANLRQTVVTAEDDRGLRIVVEHLQYLDFPVTEWVAYATNTSRERSGIVSDLRIIDGVLPHADARIVYSNGDTMNASGYEFYERRLGAEALRLTPDDGTSCNGASPYMKLLYEGFGVCIGIGWPGKWAASLQAVPNGVAIAIGQDRMHMYLNPGETMRTPRVNFLGYVGDEAYGRNVWRRWYRQHILPREHGRPLPPKLCLHDWRPDGTEFTAATEDKQLHALERYIDRGMKPDIWWFDAGWYACDGFWPYTGTWTHDEQRFPRGLAPIGQRCEELDIQFLLWFEPERVQAGTHLDTEHSDWLLYPADPQDVNRVLNYAKPEALQWTIEHVDQLIKRYNVHIYRQDLNFDPMLFWRAHEAADRIGAIENLHIQGYLTFWDEIIRRNPGLWIDSCAAGG
ncbi:alpha-galactosidase, partial [Paenibacillus sp. 598K]|uniref:alpha-galactosidase n=1 Tax=Paenibacillus sp. 598K TaxID=1117987 RepID=UPI001625647B